MNGIDGATIRVARLRSGLSQQQLARRAGTSQAAVSRIERGLESPTVERFGQLLAALGWRPEISLKPIAEHDADARRLFEAAHLNPEERVKQGLSLARFAARVAGSAAGRDGS